MDELTGIYSADGIFSTFASTEEVEFDGHKYVPDITKGYFRFKISHGFPIRTAYGTGLHPAVVAKNWRSMVHQNINWNHHVAEYFKDSKITDRITGCVIAAQFSAPPTGGWTINMKDQPFIDALGVYFKQAQGMTKIVGEHQTSRHNYTVSMEIRYVFEDSGFAIDRQGGGAIPAFKDHTPNDFSSAGFDYCPVSKAPEALLKTFSVKKLAVTEKYEGRQVTLLMGGANGGIHYTGVGIVKYGAEPTAQILRLAAAAPGGPIEAKDILEVGDSLNAFSALKINIKGGPQRAGRPLR